MESTQKKQQIAEMSRVQKIFQHPTFQTALNKTLRAEADRIFCRHGIDHLLDTARLAYIFSLERGYDLPKDLIYAAALLHDIGRGRQYEDGTPHDLAGCQLAAPILEEAGFRTQERQAILDAILGHRSSADGSDRLAEVLYDGDKASRCCFLCSAQEACNWDRKKKNLHLTW